MTVDNYRVLVACEKSQVVAKAFRAKGAEAFSCDIEPCNGDNPEWHILGDVTSILYDDWDLIIAHPPCTHLCVSGAKHFKEKAADGRQDAGISFFLNFCNLPCPRVAIENPVGIMSKIYRKPDQIIQPYQFGDPCRKTTCLWLTGLPKLVPTRLASSRGSMRVSPSGRKVPAWITNKGDYRSTTFQGIADAMADQWCFIN